MSGAFDWVRNDPWEAPDVSAKIEQSRCHPLQMKPQQQQQQQQQQPQQ
jgi:hypothetical protein